MVMAIVIAVPVSADYYLVVTAVGIVSGIAVIGIVGSVIGSIIGPAIARLIIAGAAACHCGNACESARKADHPKSLRQTVYF
jgi:large-conductance mechanosensitive channel